MGNLTGIFLLEQGNEVRKQGVHLNVRWIRACTASADFDLLCTAYFACNEGENTETMAGETRRAGIVLTAPS